MKRMGKRLLAGVMALTLTAALLPVAGAVGVDTHSSRIAGGSSHSMSIGKDGELYLWGSNSSLQLAQEKDTASLSKPETLDSKIKFVSVAAGSDFSVGLDFAGSVYVWGYNQQETPQQVNISQVAAITAGQTNILALKSDGTVWQWDVTQQPQQVAGLNDVAVISGGNGHYLALTFTGDVYAWGSNYYGQLGNGGNEDSAVPVKVPDLVDIVDIAAGTSHSLAVSYSGRVYAWGNNAYKELGTDEPATLSSPTEVSGLSNVVQVAAGNETSMALTKKGEVYTWGYGEYGQLGNGSNTISSAKPARLNNLNKVAEIAAGVYHNMALTESGSLYTWGRNRDSQLGNSKTTNANTPQRLSLSAAPQASDYSVSHFNTLSKWALKEAESLFDTKLTPPMLWGSYQTDITRAEFAHLLVGVYEQVKGSSNTDSSQTKKFTDIQDHLLASDLRKAYTLGFLSGTSDTTISPDRSITRQETAKMLCSFISKLENEKIPTNIQSLSFYSDASQIGQWAIPYIYYAYQNDIMKGLSDGSFSPNGHLTREQALIIMSRLVTKYGWSA